LTCATQSIQEFCSELQELLWLWGNGAESWRSPCCSQTGLSRQRKKSAFCPPDSAISFRNMFGTPAFFSLVSAREAEISCHVQMTFCKQPLVSDRASLNTCFIM